MTASPSDSEARGVRVIALRLALDDWRARRHAAGRNGWSPIAAAIIEIEVRALEREIAECVRELF